MTPTLYGRLQNRVFIFATLGVAWTLLITPFLPDRGRLSTAYGVTFRVLLIVAVAGLGWELVYHGLQQFRWEKDWPTLFALLVGINEGITAWFIAKAFDVPVLAAPFLVHFVTTWLVIWLWLIGPMRVVNIRWRYRGGRWV
jgi:hypothetical protein